ncbi:MAG: cell wall-binding repeat-containing protein [Firmicutes bacterium]|nr:cell wall-binding repeat-containing protein [Bacillota bacterium]
MEKANHTWDAGKITKAATQTTEGVKTYTCTVCKGTKTETIPKISKVWTRLEGATRFDTMAKIVKEGNFAKGGTVLIARGDDYRDALAASGLAGVLDAPIVLTLQKTLPNQSRETLKELDPKRVIIIGGTSAIHESVKSQIAAACPSIKNANSVERCSGKYAIDTSAEIARLGKGKWKDGMAIIARTDDFKDALSAAPIAYAKKYPIILAYNGEVFDDNVLSAMKEIGIKEFVVVGGKNAVKPKSVETLEANGFRMKQRLEGKWAVHTSGEIAEWGISLGMKADKMGVATPMNYPDALAGAALCGKNNSVMVLLNDNLPQNLEFIKKYKHSISKGYVFGGTSVVGTKTFGELEEIKK